MPLAFSSRSHGTVAFGFFNIETDMLLLENLFFLADDFCRAVVALAEDPGCTSIPFQTEGFRIPDASSMGSLHGAIQATDLGGFIGEIYRHFPFPDSPAGFKQKPYGNRNRRIVLEIIKKFSDIQTVRLSWDRQGSFLYIEEFVFDEDEFRALLAYVDRGGYPRWQDEIRPPYVRRMVEQLKEMNSPLSP